MAEAGSNAFANDGSFLDMFKKRKEQQKDSEKKKDKGTLAVSVGSTSTRVICTQTESNSTVSDSHEPSTSADQDEKPVHKPYQAIVGKRKAMMRSIELREKRKKRREEIEEQQSAEDQDNKSSAWKSYMAEVKSYEAKNCSDTDGFKRPLVK